MPKISKAIIPAAGIGSRFLPWTKSVPKEMLPIIDKPVIQYIVEECVQAGIDQIAIITDSKKRAIDDYFDNDPSLEYQLEKAGKLKELEEIRKISNLADFVYIRQKGPYGNATPVVSAKRFIGNDPFVVLWGDQFIWANPSRLKQCLEVFERFNAPTFSALPVEDYQKKSVGIGKTVKLEDNIYKLEEIVEKPGIDKAPSNLMISGVYILTPDIGPILENLKPGKDGEYWLVDAINLLLKQREGYAVEIKNGKYYDTGRKLEYHKTVVDFMLEDPEIGKEMKIYMQEKLK
ncbi:UTP--glucose-1-phosphate uridylyltransferase [Candidatus Beckwithbacteria bacterium]|nr:UTP--glucose-1-phosphate uridylyltransferase [Candidatus Beckwithbacteria bacterium]